MSGPIQLVNLLLSLLAIALIARWYVMPSEGKERVSTQELHALRDRPRIPSPLHANSQLTDPAEVAKSAWHVLAY